MTRIAAEGIALSFVPETGLLERFSVTDRGHDIAPLHRAPWVGTGEVMPPDAAPLMARLGGDFLCAPFAASEGDSPLHGWPANTPWSVERAEAGQLRAVLDLPVFGARVSKLLTLIPGHPFVYQRHIFAGGQGRVSVANHANVSLRDGGIIATSPKTRWETPRDPQESDPARGRSALRYPAQSPDMTAFPAAQGVSDLSRYPWNPRHEDFVIGIEAPGHRLGWTAVTRPASGDLFLSLRDPRQLPMTMLWHSNGGRDYAPWSGRHRGCLGVEEGAADHMLALSGQGDLCGPGGLTLTPGGEIAVSHVIGAIHWPSGERVARIDLDGPGIVIHGDGGAVREVPLDASFLSGVAARGNAAGAAQP